MNFKTRIEDKINQMSIMWEKDAPTSGNMIYAEHPTPCTYIVHCILDDKSEDKNTPHRREIWDKHWQFCWFCRNNAMEDTWGNPRVFSFEDCNVLVLLYGDVEELDEEFGDED